MKKEDFMKLAIKLAVENVSNGGGPFGAVIVRDNKVIATGVNRVTANNDPTAHAEVSAIGAACQELQSFDLSECDIYTSCEPCPMCLGAIYWAHIDHIYYGCNKHDAAAAGFDDSFIYDELELPKEQRSKVIEELLPEEAMRTFDAWRANEQKIEY
jgi:tRNA(Arg) A34 adenosine deaminase TadA